MALKSSFGKSKFHKSQLRTLSTLCALFLFVTVTAYGQITPSQDAYTDTADPTTNFGANALLEVDGAIAKAYIQFDLASIPAGASVSQAAHITRIRLHGGEQDIRNLGTGSLTARCLTFFACTKTKSLSWLHGRRYCTSSTAIV
jgi:hypothetical protein